MEKLNLKLLEELGRHTHRIRREVASKLQVGTKMSEITNFVEKKIFEKGYLPAFPCSVCVNNFAAHYTPFDKDYEFKKGDVVKTDFGISHNGFITDNAFTVEIESDNYDKLLKSNLEALNLQIEKIDYGTEMWELGKIAQELATKNGCNTIHNLTGHQISRNKIHCGLSVPNYNNSDKRKVVDNMEIAIEPYFTLGAPRIKDKGDSNILQLISTRNVRDPVAKKVLDYIKNYYPSLPFSKRWLVKEVIDEIYPNSPYSKDAFSMQEVRRAVKFLKMNHTIEEYSALLTVNGAINSQFEDTVVFVDGKKSVITRL